MYLPYLDIESNSHFLLHCPRNNIERHNLLITLRNVDPSLTEILLFGTNSFDTSLIQIFLMGLIDMFHLLEN